MNDHVLSQEITSPETVPKWKRRLITALKWLALLLILLATGIVLPLIFTAPRVAATESFLEHYWIGFSFFRLAAYIFICFVWWPHRKQSRLSFWAAQEESEESAYALAYWQRLAEIKEGYGFAVLLLLELVTTQLPYWVITSGGGI